MSGNYPGKEGSGDREGILDRREIYAQEQRWEKIPETTSDGGGEAVWVGRRRGEGANTTQPLVDIATEGTGNQGGCFSGS